MPFVIENSETPVVASSETFWLNVLINVLDSPSSALARRFRERLWVDDVLIPVKKAVWSQQETQPAGNLEIELANLADRTAFTRTAIIKFQTEEYIAGNWELAKLYCDGAILATSNYVLENDGETPADTFSVTVLPLLQQRLDTTPDQIVVLYDPAKTTVDEEKLETVPNGDGTVTGSVTVTPIAGMHLGDVLDWVADAMGFAGCHKFIDYEPWAQPRVDFPPGQPLWQTVAGIIGNHLPKLSVTADNYLVVRDGTLTDYTSARVMTLNNFKNFNLTGNIERFKGCKLERQLRSDNWDYYELEKDDDFQWFGGIAGQYPMTHVVTWTQKFYKNSFPNAPVSEQTFSVRQLEYESATEMVSASAERFSYQFGQGGIRMKRHESKEWGYGKAPQAWVNYQALLPGPNVEFAGSFGGPEEGYISASDTVFPETFVLLKAEQKTYTYHGMKGVAETVIAGQTDSEVKTLITTDTENQQLGEDYEEPFSVAQERGNLQEGQGSRWGLSDRRKEAQQSERRKRQVDIRTRRHSALNSTKPLMVENYHDRRVGDIGESEIQVETKPIYILEGADPTAPLYRSVNGGDAPMIVLNPLCLRLNAKQYLPYGVLGDLPTYDATMDLGVVIDPRVDGRASVSTGIYRVTGYTDTISGLEDGGFSTKITSAEQVAEAGSSPFDNFVFPTEKDILTAQLFKSGSAVTLDWIIRCYDGYEISLGSIAGLTIEIKHDSDVSFHDIEASPYDVSAFAGSDETFQLRFTPSSTTGIFSFRFIYQPA